MTVFLLFLKSYWKQIAGAAALALVLYLGYHKIYSIGYNKATAECAQRVKEYEEKIDGRIKSIENSSSALIEQSALADAARKKDYAAILFTIKGKPLYVIEQGKCKPSPDFVKAYNEGIERSNKP